MKHTISVSSRVRSVYVILTILLIFAFTVHPTRAEGKTLKMPCVLGPGTALWKAANDFAKQIEEKTGGEYKIKVYAPGSLVGPTQVFEALGSGVIDLAFTTGEYWAGKDPAFAFVTYLPGGFNSPVHHDFWLYERGGIDLVRQLYAKFNIRLLSMPYYPAEYLTSRVPIKTLADIKGKKLVFSGAMQHKLFTKLGAATVSMPTGERVTALERGAIDGGDFAAPNLTVALGAHQVAKYMLRTPLHQPSSALELSMSMKLWNSLPDKLKAVFTDSAYETAWACYRYSVDMDIKALEKMRAAGLQEAVMSEAEAQQVRKAAISCWEEMAADTELGKKMLEGQVGVMKEFGLIE